MGRPSARQHLHEAAEQRRDTPPIKVVHHTGVMFLCHHIPHRSDPNETKPTAITVFHQDFHPDGTNNT